MPFSAYDMQTTSFKYLSSFCATLDLSFRQRLTPLILRSFRDLNTLLAERLLEHIVCTTARAQDGRTAVNLVQTAGIVGLPFDIALLDINMPLLDGYGAAQEIRRICGENCLPVPFIIAVTANTRPEDRLRCRLTGMDGFLGKPFSKSQLSQVITSAARMRSLGR